MAGRPVAGARLLLDRARGGDGGEPDRRGLGGEDRRGAPRAAAAEGRARGGAAPRGRRRRAAGVRRVGGGGHEAADGRPRAGDGDVRDSRRVPREGEGRLPDLLRQPGGVGARGFLDEASGGEGSGGGAARRRGRRGRTARVPRNRRGGGVAGRRVAVPRAGARREFHGRRRTGFAGVLRPAGGLARDAQRGVHPDPGWQGTADVPARRPPAFRVSAPRAERDDVLCLRAGGRGSDGACGGGRRGLRARQPDPERPGARAADARGGPRVLRVAAGRRGQPRAERPLRGRRRGMGARRGEGRGARVRDGRRLRGGVRADDGARRGEAELERLAADGGGGAGEGLFLRGVHPVYGPFRVRHRACAPAHGARRPGHGRHAERGAGRERHGAVDARLRHVPRAGGHGQGQPAAHAERHGNGGLRRGAADGVCGGADGRPRIRAGGAGGGGPRRDGGRSRGEGVPRDAGRGPDGRGVRGGARAERDGAAAARGAVRPGRRGRACGRGRPAQGRDRPRGRRAG